MPRKFTHKQAADLIEGLVAELDEVGVDALNELGDLAITIITTRTKKGIDADRKSFAPYSLRYAEARTRAGYSPAPRDLARTGHMLGAMGKQATASEVTISFTSEREANKAGFQHYGTRRGIPASEFFDIRDEEEIKVMGEALATDLVARIEKHFK